MKKKSQIGLIFMAIVQNPVTGRTSGKYANAIFQKTYDQNVMRSKPIEVHDRKSVPQLTQRAKFLCVQGFVAAVLSLMRLGFKGYQQHMSAYAYGMKKNLKVAFTGTYPNYTINPATVELSDGQLTVMDNVAIGTASTSSITVTWSVPAEPGTSDPTDKINILVLGSNGQIKGVYPAIASAVDEEIAITPQGGVSFATGDKLFFFTSSVVNKNGADSANIPKKITVTVS